MKTDNNNIKEDLLIAYMYDELSAEEKRKVETYLATHPEAAAEFQELQKLRRQLASLPDQEVIVPPLIAAKATHPDYLGRLARTILAIAASLALILMCAWLTNLRVSWYKNEVRISFGKTDNPTDAPVITDEEIQAMLDRAVEAHIRNLMARQDSSLQPQEDRNQKLVKHVSPHLSYPTPQVALSDEFIKSLTTELYAENARILKELIDLSAREQKDMLEQLLIEFAQYTNQQRLHDLQKIYNRLSELEQQTEWYQRETDQILSSLITSANRTPSATIKY